MRNNPTHLSRASRKLQRLSAHSDRPLTYAQALGRLRELGKVPDLEDPAVVAQLLEDPTGPTATNPTPGTEVTETADVWADEDGEFMLADSSFGNPGCDDCGQHDAVVRTGGRYLCEAGAATAGLTRPTASPMHTAVHVLYRDASNYKQRATYVFAGPISDTDRDRLTEALDDGLYLIPTEVGLPHLGAEPTGGLGWSLFPTEDDHVWHELDEIELVDRAPNQDRTIAEFVNDVCNADWDVAAASEELGLPT